MSSIGDEGSTIGGEELDPKPFDGAETLLIGAGRTRRLRWKQCKCSMNDMTQWLKESGRLDRLSASRSYRYVDANQVSVGLGTHGVQATVSRSVKTKREEPLKHSLIQQWENEIHSRGPREFGNHWGVAISLCNMNARRVLLSDLLGARSVLDQLENFEWSDTSHDEQCPQSRRYKAYKEAVCSEDSQALSDLWKREPTWRKDLGEALLLCLRYLVKTGFDVNRNEFHVLWSPPGCHDPRRLTLKATDQNWIAFLKDTT